jgi:ubiquinone/menaquinone biosynthesis C-methylase UbiE
MKSPTASSGILQNTEHQTLVDAHFQSHVARWKDLYEQAEAGNDGATYRNRLELVLRWIDGLAFPAGERVLEIGCGSGQCTVALARRGYLVQAIDSVEGMIDSTQELAAQAGVRSSISLGLGDAHNLGFPEGTFGLVLAIGVIPYLYFPQRALSEMARVLKPGGFLVVTAGNPWRLNHVLDPWTCPLLQPAKKVATVMFRRFRKSRSVPQEVPLRFDSVGNFSRWLSAAGLTKIKLRTVGFPPPTFHYRQIFGEQTSIRLNNWLQRLADRNVPGIKSSGMDYVVLAKKE